MFLSRYNNKFYFSPLQEGGQSENDTAKKKKKLKMLCQDSEGEKKDDPKKERRENFEKKLEIRIQGPRMNSNAHHYG